MRKSPQPREPLRISFLVPFLRLPPIKAQGAGRGRDRGTGRCSRERSPVPSGSHGTPGKGGGSRGEGGSECACPPFRSHCSGAGKDGRATDCLGGREGPL